MTKGKTFIIAEVGINHNGDVAVAKQLIDTACQAGCDAVKFQKRTVEQVYASKDLDVLRDSPFGTTNREQKNGLEFGAEQYDEIDRYCRQRGIAWFASAWDLESQRFLRRYNLRYNKVASAMLTVRPLVEEIASERRYTFVSTGMSTLADIDNVVEIFRSHDCPFELMHSHSTYPMANEDANLRMIETLSQRYACKVGYSGHERGLQISLAAVALGATSIERHITLDVAMYGSDQAASLEPPGLVRLVRDIRVIELAMGDGVKHLGPAESAIKAKLSRPYWYQVIPQEVAPK